MHPDRAQAGAFLPGLLEHAGLLGKSETAEKTNEAILKLNVIIVYKRLVQGLIYSPPDCDKYLALDAKPQGLSSVGSISLWPRLWHSAIRDWQRLKEPVCKGKKTANAVP